MAKKQRKRKKEAALRRRHRRKTQPQFSKGKERQQPAPISLETACQRIHQLEAASATEILREKRDKETVLELAANACWYASDVIDRSPDKEKRMCTVGCNFCCHTTRIYLSAPEAFLIANYLRANCTPEELDTVHDRIAHTARQTSTMSDEEHTKARVPCALLSQDGKCSVYEVRPIPCRAFCSLTKDRCRKGFDTGSSTITTVVDEYAYKMATAVLEGLGYAVLNAGLDCELYELHNALLRALSGENSAELWIQGKEPLFKDCLRAVING